MIVRKATEKDLDGIENLYKNVVEFLQSHENYPGWNSEYPVRADAEEGLNMGALYVAVENPKETVVGTFMLKHRPEPGYENADWGNDFAYNEIYVVYTFAVRCDYFGNKVSDLMMDFILKEAKKDGMKAVRLDVVERNEPAIRLYERHGFQYTGTIDEGLSEYGLPWFKTYQYIL